MLITMMAIHSNGDNNIIIAICGPASTLWYPVCSHPINDPTSLCCDVHLSILSLFGSDPYPYPYIAISNRYSWMLYLAPYSWLVLMLLPLLHCSDFGCRSRKGRDRVLQAMWARKSRCSLARTYLH